MLNLNLNLNVKFKSKSKKSETKYLANMQIKMPVTGSTKIKCLRRSECVYSIN